MRCFHFITLSNFTISLSPVANKIILYPWWIMIRDMIVILHLQVSGTIEVQCIL